MNPTQFPRKVLALLIGPALAALAGPLAAQHDQVIGNADGATVRADINNALAALFSLSSGNSAPSTTVAYQLWADTTNGVLKSRNAANTGWIVRGSLAEAFVVTRSSNTILGVGDYAKFFRATSGFTQTLTAAATLGDGWFCFYRVESGATLILDPNSTETVDGAATRSIAGPAAGMIYCSGSAFFTLGFDFPAASESAAGAIELATQAEVNAMSDTARALTPNHNKIVLGTEQSASGTSVDFTGIPAGVRTVTINFDGLSTNGTSPPIVQLGISTGPETSDYKGAVSIFGASSAASANLSSGFALINTNASSVVFEGQLVLRRQSGNKWTCFGGAGRSDATASNVVMGTKSLSGELDRIRITTAGGANQFDAGNINISFER